MSTDRPLLLAFRSGSLAYDCAPCGRCCRGLGIGDDLVRIGSHAELRAVAAFLDHENTAPPLASFFTFADGCRFLGAENLCDLHRTQGRAHKPRICRLFPFSLLVDVGGLWTLLPQGSCPWVASPPGVASPLSDHASILADLQGDGGELLAALTPRRWAPLTPLAPAARLALEEAVIAAVPLDGGDGTAGAALAAMSEVQRAHAGEPIAPPADPELWIDILRSRGQPPRLAPEVERLLCAALPVLRVHLTTTTALAAVPAVLHAFVLWLRTLAELRTVAFTGEDLLALLRHAEPLVRVMAVAEQPIPELPDEPASPQLADLWPDLLDHQGEPLGEAVLASLRVHEQGALPLLMQLGDAWPQLAGWRA